jgi:hypothetical protein
VEVEGFLAAEVEGLAEAAEEEASEAMICECLQNQPLYTMSRPIPIIQLYYFKELVLFHPIFMSKVR